MLFVTFKIMCVLIAWGCWYILFGIDCYVNGLMTRRSWDLPFYGLYQDCEWFAHPSRRPDSYPVLNILHLLLILPVIAACFL